MLIFHGLSDVWMMDLYVVYQREIRFADDRLDGGSVSYKIGNCMRICNELVELLKRHRRSTKRFESFCFVSILKV